MPHAGGTSAAGPSRLWYLLALAVFAAGFVAMGVFLSKQLSGLGDGLVQIVVPGEAELALGPGRYTIFHETQSTVGGKPYQSDEIAGLTVLVVSPTGETVALTTPTMSGSYELQGRRGVAAFGFEIGEPGTYRLSARFDEGAAGPETVLAVSKGFSGTLATTVLGALALVFICAGVAVAIAVSVFVKRRRAQEAIGPMPERATTGTTGKRFALPATKTFAYVCGVAFAGLVIWANAKEAIFGPEPHPAYPAILLALAMVTMYSAAPLLVRGVIGFQSAFWKGVGKTTGSATVTGIVREATPGARMVGDIIVLVIWAGWALGLAIALPAMIRDGFFS